MDKVYAVFGASGGIGSVLTRRLSADGARVCLIGRNEAKLKSLAEEVSQPYFLADACEEASVQEVFKIILEKEGRVDGAVSLVGSLFLKPLAQTSQKQFEEVMKTNVSSVFCILKHAIASMKKGSIVCCSSTAALIGLVHHESIGAAKGAVAAMVRAAAASVAPIGIRINAVAPGLTRTPLSEPITSNPAALKASAAFHPLGRPAEPHEIASAISWLLSDESSFVTGEVLAVDGGLSSIKRALNL